MSQEYIDKLRQINEDADSLIKETRQAFVDMATEKANESREVIKAWANEIKSDKEKLQTALDYANEVGLLDKFMQAIMNGYCHRMCFRTFYVHEYIYNELRLANQATAEIDNLLRGIEDNESPEGDK